MLSQAESKVCERIASRAVALLEDLRLHVGLPTGGLVGPALDETRDRFAQRLRALGATLELVPGEPRPAWVCGDPEGYKPPPSLVCRRVKGISPRILVSGHLDTVHEPSSPFRHLTMAPDGKTATGPGCVDMKGGLVIAVAALEALEEIGAGVSWSVIFNSDEETGSYHSDRAIVAEAARHDVGLALEPATPEGGLVVEHPGNGQFEIETFGKAAHVGRDFASGVSAVVALAERIVSSARLADPVAGKILCIGPIEGGTATNVVPDHAKALGNVRFKTPELGVELAKALDALATSPDAMPRAVVRHSFNRPAKPRIEGTMALAELARTAAEDLGQKLPFSATGGVCDGNNLQAAGMPTIDTVGVRGGGLHTSKEWIEIPSLVERCQMLAVLMLRIHDGKLDHVIRTRKNS